MNLSISTLSLSLSIYLSIYISIYLSIYVLYCLCTLTPKSITSNDPPVYSVNRLQTLHTFTLARKVQHSDG